MFKKRRCLSATRVRVTLDIEAGQHHQRPGTNYTLTLAIRAVVGVSTMASNNIDRDRAPSTLHGMSEGKTLALNGQANHQTPTLNEPPSEVPAFRRLTLVDVTTTTSAA